MTTEDDLAYRRSVRNMSYVLAAIVLTVFAAVLIPPYLNSPHDAFQKSVSFDSPVGFTMHLTVNTTSPSTSGHVLITGWLNSTSNSLENITASDQWFLGPSGLWTAPCRQGWPVGIGIMKGHYDQSNYSEGSLLPIVQPAYACPLQPGTPSFFLLESHSSRALVDIGGSPQYWNLTASYSFGHPPQQGIPAGVYTAVLADEWGDVLTTNFQVP